MKEVSFVDTNILVYAYDSNAGKKHELAMNLIDGLWSVKNGILSTQVLCEFFVIVTKKIPNPIPVNYARQIIEDYALSWEIVGITQYMILQAIDTAEHHKLSFWDALIFSAANNYGATLIYSEDFSHGIEIDGIKVINPFLL